MIYLQLIWSYFKIGLFGFGGGYAMLSLIQSEVVLPGWITEQAFTDIVAISQMTPGPIGINSATYIGYVAPHIAGYEGLLYGIIGSILCTAVVVLPPFILCRYATHIIMRHNDSMVVKSVFAGLRPVIIGLIGSAALLLMNTANFGETTVDITKGICICVCIFFLVYYTKVHPILYIILAGVAGLILY